MAGERVAGGGLSDLAPTYDVVPPSSRPRERTGGVDDARKARGTDPGSRRSTRPQPDAAHTPEAVQPPRSPAPTARPDRPRRERSPQPVDAAPVTVSDPAGDQSASLQGPGDAADIVAVRLDVTGDTVEVRTTFVGEVPARMTGRHGMNVASFYDVDGNGLVDYEIWVSLADNGWGTGYRDARESTAAFGPGTGIEVEVSGRTLTTRFPRDLVGGAQRFRWSAASEWGSHESMAASTSARDHAPDDGAATYPG